MVDLLYCLINLLFFRISLLYYYINLRSPTIFCLSCGDMYLCLGISLSCVFLNYLWVKFFRPSKLYKHFYHQSITSCCFLNCFHSDIFKCICSADSLVWSRGFLAVFTTQVLHLFLPILLAFYKYSISRLN